MKWMLMPLRRYAEFSGRSRRKEYWMFFLGAMLLYALMVVLLFGTVGSAILNPGAAGASGVGAVLAGGFIGLLIMFVWLALLVPTLAVGVRRLHDIDKSGWWMMIGYGPYLASIALTLSGAGPMLSGLLSIVSFFGFLVLLVMAMLNGTNGPNRFGEDPKGGSSAEIFA
jgi:uncharacterized membrane protein YhaH (DUF805 family)